jgi:hypothetical protein
MKRTPIFFASIVVVTVVFLLLVAFGAIPFGMPRVWVWQYQPLNAPTRLAFPLVAFAALLGVLVSPVRKMLNEKPTRQTERRVLLSLWLVSVLMASCVALLHPAGWMHTATLIINPASNSYFSTAIERSDLPSLLDGYEQKMRDELVSHAQTQSAGPVVLCGLLRQVFTALPFTQEIADTLFALSPGVNSEFIARQSAKWWQVSLSGVDVSAALMIAFFFVGVGGLAVVPIYYLGKWLHDEQVGVCAAVAFTLLPSFHSFTVSVDQMYPFVSMTALCFITLALRSPRRSGLWAGAAGVWIALAVFLNLGLVTLLLLCGLFAAFLRQRARLPWRDGWRELLAFIVGLLAPWCLLWLIFRYNLLAVFRTSDDLRHALYAREHRSYAQALIGNLADFFIFAGLPATLLFCWGVVDTVRDAARRSASPLLWSFLLLLLALDLSGKTRGEVGRMWMFLMPCVLLIAAPQAQKIWRESRGWMLALLVCQFAQVVVFQYCVRVWGY